MSPTTPPTPAVPPTRRDVLRGAATLTIAGASVTVLSGCGGGSGGSAASSTVVAPTLTDESKAAIAAAVTSGKVPVGKSAILPVGIIVSQPTAGQYVALSSICPHAGGKVTEVSDRGFLRCPLHGSEFDPATGEVKIGPSNKPLGTQKISVNGDTVKPV